MAFGNPWKGSSLRGRSATRAPWRRSLRFEPLQSRQLLTLGPAPLGADGGPAGGFEPLADSPMPFRVTEIMYHPTEPTAEELLVDPTFDEDDFEFIELMNVGSEPVNVLDCRFTEEFQGEGITFTFGDLEIGPGERVVVVKNEAAFSARYETAGLTIAGSYGENDSSLSNGGETLTLLDADGETIQQFFYDDQGSWPGRADGKGSSLEVLDTAGDYNDPDNWRSSSEYGGSPGVAGTGPYLTVAINEVLSNPIAPDLDAIELYNTTAEPIDVGGWWLSDSTDELFKFQIPPGTILPGDGTGYVVFDETDFRPGGGTLPTDFGLDADGDGVWLVEVDAAGKPVRFADKVEFGAAAPGMSFGRWPNGTGELLPMISVTLGAENSGTGVGDVVISEIMYHPSSENDLEEYIELYHRGLEPVSLAGWQITAGVDFTFPDVTLGPQEYLVVAADVATFTAKYPGVANVVGGWDGHLSNKSEEIELVDAFGDRVDRVTYADEGDWGVRELGPRDHGHRGWTWVAEHDGLGKSLELINPALSNNYGQNWAASTVDQGTPGTANSTAAADVAPIILDVTHFPVIPRSSDPVTVTAEVIDELTTGLTVTLFWRVDTSTYSQEVYPTYDPASYQSLAMYDDGLHGDGKAGDGVYGAVLPTDHQQDGTIVEFYVQASDAAANVRTWPAPSFIDGVPQQVTNLLYQVDDGFDPEEAWTPGSRPIYRLIMTEADRARLVDIGNGGAETEQNSNAQVNATFITVDGTGAEVRYNAGVRNRGHGSRTGPPNNYRVNFVHDRPWDGVTAVNLNSRYPFAQVLGSAIFQLAGVAAADARLVEVRVNGANLATAGSPMYGSYAALEVLDSDFAENHYPDDSAGNLYKCLDDDAGDEADLKFEGYDADAYRNTYFKQTNDELDDWSDLIALVDALNNTPDESFLDAVGQVMDVDQWVRYLAVDALLGNLEGGLTTGIGDDYAMYRGVADPRFVLVPHDLDTVFGEGGRTPEPNRNIFVYTGVQGFNQLLSNPEVVTRYYGAFVELIETVYNPATIDPLIDQLLGGFMPADVIADMKQFVVDRTAGVLAQIPRQFSIESDLPQSGGYYRTVLPEADLHGTMDAAATRSVLVGGLPAELDPRAGQWVIGSQTGGLTETLVQRGAVWRYLDDGSNQGTAWYGTGFNDSGWSSGPAQLGYGDGDERTTVYYGGDGNNKYITTYFRHSFQVDDPTQYVGLTLWLLRDDGAVVYLNGQELFTDNMRDEPINYQTTARSTIGGADEDAFYPFNIDPAKLVAGTNVLAVEIHQISGTSSDISFDLGLEGILPSGQTGVPLVPGINRLAVEAYDGPNGTGQLVDSGYVDVWYDPPLVLPNRQLEVTVRDSYLPGTPLLVRAEILDEHGEVDREVWDAVVTLSADRPDVILSATQIPLYNGLGSALVTATGSGDFTLTARVGDLEVSRTLVSLEGEPMTEVSGTLPGSATTFSGIVHVTGDLLVPAGHTLTIEPGTLVLLDGVASGTTGTDIDVQGEIRSLGTALEPVTFTAYDAAMPWGEIHHDNATPSTYQYTNITRAGHSPQGGHANAGPAIRPVGSTIVFDHVSVTDIAGKTMEANGSDLTFYDSLLARSIMGPEIAGTALWFEDSFVADMHAPDDGDGIYIYTQQAGQTVTLLGGAFAVVDDDAIDTLGSDVTIQNVIIRDANDKGISVYNGEVTIDHCLLADDSLASEDGTASTISAKGTDGATVTVNVSHSTVVGRDIGIEGRNKSGVPNVVIRYFVTNSIITATDPIRTDYDPADIHVSYCNVLEAWPGDGNINADPLFVSPAAHNYHLQPGSPSIDAGDPVSPNDPDGTRADQGFYQPGVEDQTDPRVIAGGTIDESTVLAARGGPYRVTGDVVIAPGTTLTILPGTTVFFEPGTGITVNGHLVAEGSQRERIRLTRVPGAAGQWDGLAFVNSLEDSRLGYVDMEYGDAQGESILLDHGRVTIDSMTWSGTDETIIEFLHPSLEARNSFFPAIAGSEVIHGEYIEGDEYFLLDGNVFDVNTSGDDVLDLLGAERPGPVFQILNNVFLGGGDDGIDLDGADAHVEGNLFMHFHKNTTRTTTSNALSTGKPQTGESNRTEVTVVRNVFVDNDHAILLKEDAFATVTNNVFLDSDLAVIQFDEPDGTGVTGPGRGAYLDGNILWDNTGWFKYLTAELDLVINRSILPAAYHGYGTGNIDEDPRLADPAGGDFRLLPGSPALGAGPNGLDFGAMVPGGASLAGEPPALTGQTSATLTVGGPGITHYKYRLNDGPWSGETPVDTPISLAALADGDYVVYAIGKDTAGRWQSESEATASQAWTVDTSLRRVQINEVLAINALAVDHEGTFPDLIELVNSGAVAVSLDGMSLSDDAANPAKFVFTGGPTLEPGERLVLYADDRADTTGIHLGFALDGRQGEGVYLFESAANGGGMLDQVEFGLQVPDLSIGRVGHDGHWALTVPTFGEANAAQRTGDPATLRINEWLASGSVLFGEDFIELYNPDPLPVALGGLYLTDRPAAQPDKQQIAPLSFVAGGGCAWFEADGNAGGAGHVDFRLSAQREWLALLDADLEAIDTILFVDQTSDVSQGLAPNGGQQRAFFTLPTPGVVNPATTTQQVNLVGLDQAWAYNQSGNDLGTAWRQRGYDDSLWSTGAGPLGFEDDPLPPGVTINTDLTRGPTTFYFRSHFALDADPADVALQLTMLLDDGAVIYINGDEAFRLGMSPGGVSYDTFADRVVDNAVFEGPYTIPTTALVRGDNLIAVEVHQGSGTSTDVVFGMTLDAAITVTEDPLLAKARTLLDGLRLTELMYNPDGGSDFEFVELKNTSDGELDLTGLRFTDGIQFTFPEMLLGPGEYVVVVADQDRFESRYGSRVNVAGQYSGNLDNAGEGIVLQLASPLEAAILRFDYNNAWYPSTDGQGFALEIVDPAVPLDQWSEWESWQAGAVDGGTPGRGADVPRLDVLINEVLTHTDIPDLDSIELVNLTDQPIDLSGWYLSDSNGDFRKFRIPDGTILPATLPGEQPGYLVFDEDDFNTSGGVDPGDFALDGAHGDDVWLLETDAEGNVVRIADHVRFGAAANGVSFGRWPDSSGELYPMQSVTLGAENSGPRVGELVISEIMYHPPDPGDGTDPSDLEFIEVYNPGSSIVELAGWRLGGGVDFGFPAGSEIGPHGTLVVVPFDPDDAANAGLLAAFRATYGIGEGVALVGGFDGRLDNAGDTVRLFSDDFPPDDDPTFVPLLLEDEAAFDDVPPWPVEADGLGSALARVAGDAWGNDPQSWTAAAASPGTVPFDVPRTLDVDSSGAADALTDGVVILRYLFGFRGQPMVEGVLAPDATRTDPAQIAALLDNARDTMLDADANGAADALTDGVIILRYLFGFTGTPLVEGALGPNAERTDPAAIETFLDQFNPDLQGASPMAPLAAVDANSVIEPQNSNSASGSADTGRAAFPGQYERVDAVWAASSGDDPGDHWLAPNAARRTSLYRALAYDAVQTRAKARKRQPPPSDEVDLQILMSDA